MRELKLGIVKTKTLTSKMKGNNQFNNPWTEDEINIIKENYLEKDNKYLSELLCVNKIKNFIQDKSQ